MTKQLLACTCKDWRNNEVNFPMLMTYALGCNPTHCPWCGQKMRFKDDSAIEPAKTTVTNPSDRPECVKCIKHTSVAAEFKGKT